MSLLGDEILEIAEDHILTKQKENYQLLMWNYCDYTEAFAKGDRSCLSLLDRDGAFDEKPACVRANVPLKGHYLQTVYTLDKSTSGFPKVKDTTPIPRWLLLNRYSRRAG